MFREQYLVTDEESLAVRDTSIFIAMLYIEAWFTASLVSATPNHYLQFFKNLYNYKSIDQEVSDVILQKFRNHLWYLNADVATLSFCR